MSNERQAINTEVITSDSLNDDLESLQELRSFLTSFLGVTESLPNAVVASAAVDPLYFHHLLTCRDAPKLLAIMLKSPPRSNTTATTDKTNLTNVNLSKKAIKSFWKWAKTGFSFVEKERYEARLKTCYSCPNCTTPTEAILYKLLAVSKTDANENKICGLCGCLVARKAMLPSESCPDTHPFNSTLTRWGEQLEPAA